MKRPSKGSGPSAKAGRRKASKLLGGRTPREASRRTKHTGDETGEIARLSRELKEAREQQAATAGVLRMISRFPSDLHSVLEAIIRVAAELCEAEYALLFRLYDGKYSVACS
jgi:adenylate cyclase